MPRTVSRLASALSIASLATTPALALVQDYQVVRLITYRTSCDLLQLDHLSPQDGSMRFHATCGDLVSYPDGIDVVCYDREDDRSCKILTTERKFENLDLLQRTR